MSIQTKELNQLISNFSEKNLIKFLQRKINGLDSKIKNLTTDFLSIKSESRAEQSRAEQSRAEQSRAEQSRAEQSRAEQSRAEQSRAEQSRAEQSRAEQSRAFLLSN